MEAEKKEGKGGFLSSLMPSWLKGRRASRQQEADEKKGDPTPKAENPAGHAPTEPKAARKWDYKQQGADWAPILPCDLSCKRQSPIEIDPEALKRLLDRCTKGEATAEEVSATGNLLKLAPAQLLLHNDLATAAPAKGEQVVFDCGYKLQLKPSDAGSFGTLGRGDGDEIEKYQAVQFHFHAPAEHTLGSRAPLELHIVCKCLNDLKEDQHLVLGVFFDNKEGKQQCAFLQACEAALLDSLTEDTKAQLPERVNAALGEAQKDLGEPQGCIDLKALLPDDATLIVYEGSLTTPPCSENVHWYVLRDPLPASAEQLKRFGLYLQSGEGAEARGNYRLRQNVEVKANEQPLHVLAPGLPPKDSKVEAPSHAEDTADAAGGPKEE